MCTAVSWRNGGHYFGRNLDLEHGYGEQVTVTPRNYPFRFRAAGEMENHYAMIGMACVAEGYPLYYDATNEKGLSMAGLNFPGNAVYRAPVSGKDNVAPFEFIPWVLGQCADLEQAEHLLRRLNLADIPFSSRLPLTPLHWLLSDSTGSLVVEPMKDSLHIYRNPVEVLTNSPPFNFHMANLCQYRNLTPEEAEPRFSGAIDLQPFSRGMGAIGLPGDFSSPSRFVRAAFVKLNSCSNVEELACVSQFFHILGSVAMPRGCVRLGEGTHEITRYTSCCSADTLSYYCSTYESRQITAVDMHKVDLEGNRLFIH